MKVDADRYSIYLIWLIAGAMLASAALWRHPYSFYTLLRWVCCPIFAYSAVIAFQNGRIKWTWVFGVLAGLYNPISPVRLDRQTWIVVNWFTVIAIVIAAVLFWSEHNKAKP
jgi:hypothetical protein